MDGYPMHGRFGQDGTVPQDLDACGGHVAATAEWPRGVYHYHATGAVDADHGGRTYRPFIRCFRGAIGSSDNPQRRGNRGAGHPPGGPPPGGAPPPP